MKARQAEHEQGDKRLLQLLSSEDVPKTITGSPGS